VGGGWDGGLNPLYNNLCMWLIYMSNVTYFINAPSYYISFRIHLKIKLSGSALISIKFEVEATVFEYPRL